MSTKNAISKTVQPLPGCTADLESSMSPRQADSLASRIARLDIGRTVAESIRLEFDKTTRDAFRETVKALRSTMSKAAERARQRNGGEYVVETGDFRTRAGDLMTVATVTRIS